MRVRAGQRGGDFRGDGRTGELVLGVLERPRREGVGGAPGGLAVDPYVRSRLHLARQHRQQGGLTGSVGAD